MIVIKIKTIENNVFIMFSFLFKNFILKIIYSKNKIKIIKNISVIKKRFDNFNNQNIKNTDNTIKHILNKS